MTSVYIRIFTIHLSWWGAAVSVRKWLLKWYMHVLSNKYDYQPYLLEYGAVCWCLRDLILYQLLCSSYSGRMVIGWETELRILLWRAGSLVLLLDSLHRADVVHIQDLNEVIPVSSGRSLTSRLASWCWMVVGPAISVTPSSLTLLKAVCILSLSVFSLWNFDIIVFYCHSNWVSIEWMHSI